MLGKLNSLKNSKVDATTLLIESISKGRTKDDLLLIGWCLRFGANPNIYLDVDTIGTGFHIAGYAYLVGSTIDNAYMNTLFLLLLASGMDVSKPAFEEEPSGRTIGQWLSRYYNIEELYGDDFRSHITVSVRDFIYTILDQPENVLNPDPTLIAKSHARRMLSKYKKTRKQVFWDSKDLTTSIESINAMLFEFLNKKGELPGYPTMNTIILLAQNSKKKDNIDEEKAYLSMVQSAVKLGVELDRYQLALIDSFRPELYKSMSELGEAPFWEKSCRNTQGEIGRAHV